MAPRFVEYKAERHMLKFILFSLAFNLQSVAFGVYSSRINKKFSHLMGKLFKLFFFFAYYLIVKNVCDLKPLWWIACGVLMASMWAGSRLNVIGLTGGIACGKSTVSEELKKQGVVIIDADLIAHRQMDENESLKADVIKAFGGAVATKDGKIDRAKLSQLIFEDPSKRKILNQLTHYRIFKAMLWEIISTRIFQMKDLVVLDAPLLYETGVLEHICYPIIVVHVSDIDEQVKRLIGRNAGSEGEALLKIKSQMPIKKKVERAHILIDNGKSMKEV